MVNLSVIIPIFNEAESLTEFIGELNDNLSKLKQKYEILAIDDGSTDNTLHLLHSLADKNKHLAVYNLRKNFGKSAAYLVGFSNAKGKTILTIDADGQDRPSQIKKILYRLSAGFDVVVGRRVNRQDSWSKKFASRIWNYFLRNASGIELHDVDCGLKAFRRGVLKNEYFRGDFHRYLPVIIGMDGYRVTETEVEHHKRKKGKSKYSLTRIFPAIFDFFTNMFLSRFAFKPMHFFGPSGLFVLTLGLMINAYLTVLKILGETIGGRPLLILGVLLTITGLQLIFTGFLGDLITRGTRIEAEDYL